MQLQLIHESSGSHLRIFIVGGPSDSVPLFCWQSRMRKQEKAVISNNVSTTEKYEFLY